MNWFNRFHTINENVICIFLDCCQQVACFLLDRWLHLWQMLFVVSHFIGSDLRHCLQLKSFTLVLCFSEFRKICCPEIAILTFEFKYHTLNIFGELFLINIVKQIIIFVPVWILWFNWNTFSKSYCLFLCLLINFCLPLSFPSFNIHHSVKSVTSFLICICPIKPKNGKMKKLVIMRHVFFFTC